MNSRETGPDKLAVFDVCDTLYYSNTTHDFVRFVIERPELGKFKKAIHALLNSKVLPVRYFLIFVSITTGWDAAKAINLRFLSGMPEAELEKSAQRFVSEFLNDRKIEETNELLTKFRDEGLRIVLCSSSIEPVVTAVARSIGVGDHISSTLIYDGGIFSGRIAEETVGKKLEFLTRSYPRAEIVFAVSDNKSDLGLMSAANSAIAVVHDSAKRKFWRERRFEIIDLRT